MSVNSNDTDNSIGSLHRFMAFATLTTFTRPTKKQTNSKFNTDTQRNILSIIQGHTAKTMNNKVHIQIQQKLQRQRQATIYDQHREKHRIVTSLHVICYFDHCYHIKNIDKR